MVDGVGNYRVISDEVLVEKGKNNGFDDEMFIKRKENAEEIKQQDFKDADLIVIGVDDESLKKLTLEKNLKDGFGEYECFEYPLWAIYGNTVVESSIHKGNIKDYNKTKVVLAKRKPYILNGDW